MSDFERKVFAAVKKIPRGKVLTYGQVARRLGNAGLARAVGNALNKNRDKAVPCHRVVRADGYAGGFAWGTGKKISLLRREGVKIGGDGKINPR